MKNIKTVWSILLMVQFFLSRKGMGIECSPANTQIVGEVYWVVSMLVHANWQKKMEKKALKNNVTSVRILKMCGYYNFSFFFSPEAKYLGITGEGNRCISFTVCEGFCC